MIKPSFYCIPVNWLDGIKWNMTTYFSAFGSKMKKKTTETRTNYKRELL